MNKLKFSSMCGRFLAGLAPLFLVFVPAGAWAQNAQNPLVTTQFITLGEGLAAGMADFGLRDLYQNTSFPAVMAAQMQTAFPQPLIQPPGLGVGVPGFATMPGGYPVTLQGSVRDDFPPNLFVFNLAMPGATLSDALNYRPAFPLIQTNNPKQTAANLILGYPTMILGQNLPLWSQVDYAVAMNPTLCVVELGFFDVLNAAVNNNPSLLPDVPTFASNYATVLSRLKASSPNIVVTTIPDPFDTAFFTNINSAPNYLGGAPPATLALFLAMGPNDYFTPNGLLQAATQLLTGTVNPIFSPFSALPGVTVTAATQAAVETNLAALNAAIRTAAQKAGSSVIVYDLQAALHQVALQGLTVATTTSTTTTSAAGITTTTTATTGTTTLTSNYLGGFYSLDGYYPGQTGQAMIANQILSLLNSTYNKSFPLVSLTTTAASDPALRARPDVLKLKTMVNPRGVEMNGMHIWEHLK